MNEIQPSEPKINFSAQTKWFLGIFIHPKKTINKIAQQAGRVWLFPLLIMSVLAIAYAGASARVSPLSTPVNMQEMDSDNIGMEVPLNTEGMQYIASDSEQIPAAPKSSVLLGGISGIMCVWGNWIILSAVLYLSLTLSGGRTEIFRLMNVVSWGGLPFALRDLVRIISVSLTRTAILHPGLSGLSSAEAGGSALFFGALLSLVDIYLFWNLGLLVLGGKAASGLTVGKSLKAVLVPVLILLALYALVSAGTASLTQQIMEGASIVGEF